MCVAAHFAAVLLDLAASVSRCMYSCSTAQGDILLCTLQHSQ